MKLYFVVSLFFFLLSNGLAITGCHDNEREALLSFKSHLTDPSNRLSSWKNLNCCSWHGIQCSDSLHVVAVDLRNPNPSSFIINMNSELVSTSNSISTALNGTISSSLFTLTHIHYLDLSYNNFMSSRIPSGLANLTNLIYLNLSNAMLSDSITTQFSNLTSLKWLDLSCSSVVDDFSSIILNLSSSLTVHAGSYYNYIFGGYLSSFNLDWLKGLTNLRELQLSSVNLSEASLSTQWANPIAMLSNLRLLRLSNCEIFGKVPIDQLLNLTQLSVLQMDFNPLTSRIPAQLANLTSLLVLHLTGSNLHGPIPYLPQLIALHVSNSNLTTDLKSIFSVPWPALESLDISSTHVSGSIPSSISNTTTLISFIAFDCLIEGFIPSSITNLSRLETLELDINSLVGPLPPSLSNMKSLGLLSLMQNSLEGPIPDSICNISSLWYLALASNSFTGKLPECIGHLPNIKTLYVSLNSLTGTIQSVTGLFKSSTPYAIGLSFNNLTVKLDQGPVPPSFQPQILDLSSCNIEGSIPDFLSNMTQLTFLSLANKKLSGTIPSWLFNLAQLSYLELSFNNLQGFLPTNISLNSNFGPTTLNLASNRLQGPIPSLLENIDAINLSNNNFTGHVPNQIGLGSVRYLSLSSNKLFGQIPHSFCQENNVLMLLDLSNNSLSGFVPRSLGNCTSLSFLNIGHNYFSGRIPVVLENAKNLSYLELTGNHFDGPFPSFIQKLKTLVVLKMGQNKFVGKIPQFIGDLQNLRILVLQSNFFNESIPQEKNKLEKLQIMDLSNNKLHGPIPEKLDGLKMLRSRPTDGDILGYVISAMYVGVELSMAYKGLVYQFEVVRTYHSGIDLSHNSLVGNIPREIGLLKGLSSLNLSHNILHGEIPITIGDMNGLESLDLSFNNLSREIPESINLLDSLSFMNLSYNNLSGKIPSGTRFDTLYGDGSAFFGNKYLCGAPDGISCNTNASSSSQETDIVEDDREMLLFYGIVMIGYGVGLWGFLGVLYLMKEQWRESYWRTIDKIALRIMRCMQGCKRTSVEIGD